MNQLVHMTSDGNGGSRPATRSEVAAGKSTGTLPLAQVASAMGPLAPTASCGPGVIPATSYIDPGSSGACRPGGEGLGIFGAHLNATGGVAVTTTAVSPERPVNIRQALAGGSDLANWKIRALRINQDPILHGADAPASIFSKSARYPVEFDADLSTADTVTFSTLETVAAVVGAGEDRLMIGFQTCFDSRRGLDFPCRPVTKRNNRQIILGIGVGVSPTENLGVATLSDSPDTPIRLGRLILEAVYNGTPDASPEAGVTATNGQRALQFIEVTQIDINGVTIFTTSPINGPIPGESLSVEAGGILFPDLVATQSDTLNIAVRNRAPAHAGAGANTITVNAAIIGCEVLAC